MTNPPVDVLPILEKIDYLISKMTHVKMDISLNPKKEHVVTSIKYQGLNQMRQEFVEALTSSITRYVLSKSQYNSRLKELKKINGLDDRDASAIVYQEVRNYFRKSDIKGQFSELLLYNFLQYHFKAIPVVRKMTITTNTEVERHGADAIHLGVNEKNENCIYLGEAKTYPSGFLQAFKNAITSIITAYNEHRNELQIYKYDNVTPEVRTLIKKYLEGDIDLPVKLVIIISYCTGKPPVLTSGEEYHKYFVEHVLHEIKSIKDSHYRDEDKNPMHPSLLSELNYIIFPVNELQDILDDFQRKLGIK